MKYRFGTRVISFLLCIAMVLGLKLELPVNARAEGEQLGEYDTSLIYYVGDIVNLPAVLPSGARIMRYDKPDTEYGETLTTGQFVVKPAVDAKIVSGGYDIDVWAFEDCYRITEGTTNEYRSVDISKEWHLKSPVGFKVVGPKKDKNGNDAYTFAYVEEHRHKNWKGFFAHYDYDKLKNYETLFFLTGDVHLTSTWVLPMGITQICLNGHSIYLDGDGDVIRINPGSTLHIYDEEGEGRGKPGNITHYGGEGIGVHIAGGELQMYGGSFVMNDGSINRNTVQTGDGGGVYIDGSGKIQMKGGTIEKNTVKAGNGGGVYIDVGSEFSMEGNSVVQSNAAENGGGVYVGASSTFNMNGSAQVKENHAGKAGSGACKGGGVFVSYTGKLSMQSESALIKDNWSEGGNGGGVYLDGKFEYKSGKVIGNIANTSDGVKADNVYIPNGRIIDIPDEAAEDEDHEVWVSMQTPGVFTNNAGKLRAPISWFKSDDTNYVVGWYDSIKGNKIE